MGRYNDLEDAFTGAPPQHLLAFTAAVAERMYALYEAIAPAIQSDHCRTVVDLGWEATLDNLDENKASEVVEQAEIHLESITDDLDPDSKEFIKFQFEMIAVNTIALHLNPSIERAITSEETFNSILSAWDLAQSDISSYVIRAGDEPTLGPLQLIEKEAFDQVVADLRIWKNKDVHPCTIQEIKEKSKTISLQYRGHASRVLSSLNSED